MMLGIRSLLYGLVRIRIFMLILLLCGSDISMGNNLKFTGEVKVISVTGGMVTMEIPVSWDNSWRDGLNWDGAWVFLKYKKRGDIWSHAYLETNGHSVKTTGLACLPQQTDGKVVGVLVYRSEAGTGRVEATLEIKWKLPAPIASATKSAFESKEILLAAHGIEMVYVPNGSFALGDSVSQGSFLDKTTKEVAMVETEDQSLALTTMNNQTVNLAAEYPKGYAGFFVMKYEVSQEQYVTFLNGLGLEQQESLLPQVSGLSPGDYIFGEKLQPSVRNGIILTERLANQPIVFGNNLTNDKLYGQENDGATVACNYMGIVDMLAYSSWAGLRPMSELEYEKACRPFLPAIPKGAEYAWNSIEGAVPLTALREANNNREEPTDGNVNAANGFNGPVRCGSFASAAGERGQLAAGASWWGVMEMSGNLGELCSNVNSGLKRDQQGRGIYNLSTWSKTPGHYGVRGGSFSGNEHLMRVSDRTEALSYYPALTNRDSTVGFRLVRSLNEMVNPGKIGVALSVKVLCPGGSVTILNIESASVEDSTMSIFYRWYLNDQLIPEARGKELVYDQIVNTGNTNLKYTFKRVASTQAGDNATTFSISVPGRLVMNVREGDLLSTGATEFIAKRNAIGKITWTNIMNGAVVRTDAAAAISSFAPTFAIFGYNPTTYTVRCESDVEGCKESIDVVLNVQNVCAITLNTNRVILSAATPPVVATTKLPVKITWLQGTKVIRTTTAASDTYTPNYYDMPRQVMEEEIVCQTVLGECKDEKVIVTDASRMQGCPATVMIGSNQHSVVKIGNLCWMSQDANFVMYTWDNAQNICPPGWRLPDNNDWNTLVTAVSNRIADSRFKPSGNTWSSDAYSSGNGYFYYINGTTMGCNYTGKANKYSVRCVKNAVE